MCGHRPRLQFSIRGWPFDVIDYIDVQWAAGSLKLESESVLQNSENRSVVGAGQGLIVVVESDLGAHRVRRTPGRELDFEKSLQTRSIQDLTVHEMAQCSGKCRDLHMTGQPPGGPGNEVA